MLVGDRRNRLLEFIRAQGFASLPELADNLAVSESTVRRDLDHLEETGSAKRTHGGVFYTGPSPSLKHFTQTQSKNIEKKRQIAQAVGQMIEDGDTVLLDGGSTTYELAQILCGRPIQVVTNSLPVANLFSVSDTNDLVLIGGNIHTRTGVSLGPYANSMLSNLNCRRAILSTGAIHEDGFFNSNLLLVETERAMMQAADEVIIVADSTKFGRRSLAKVCELDAVDMLVVDHELSEDWQSRMIAAGVNLKIADPTETP